MRDHTRRQERARESSREYRLFYRALLQKRPVISRSLLIEATPWKTTQDNNSENFREPAILCLCCKQPCTGRANILSQTWKPNTFLQWLICRVSLSFACLCVCVSACLYVCVSVCLCVSRPLSVHVCVCAHCACVCVCCGVSCERFRV